MKKLTADSFPEKPAHHKFCQLLAARIKTLWKKNRKIKYVNIAGLSIGYEEQGDTNCQTVILLHGFPDDIRTWDRVTEKLVARGFRTLTPYLRGVGEANFTNISLPKFGNTSTLSSYLAEFAKAIGLKDFLLVGHDLGADASFLTTILNPNLIKGHVLLAVSLDNVR